MQGGKNWIFPKDMNANKFFWDSHWLEIWSYHSFPSMGYGTEWRERGYGPVVFCNILMQHTLMYSS
jgi:hypothetical protein